MNLFKNAIVIFSCISVNILYSNTKELYKDVSGDSVITKTVSVLYTDFGKDLYCGGYGEDGKVLTELMGETPYSALGFSYKGEDYYISIKKSAFNDSFLDMLIDKDSIEITIEIFPFFPKRAVSAEPFSIVTNMKKLSKD
ncbi:MAG: hypothetical protein K2I64_00560 [Muribaculaceae bacterium]|nr:hypothetical protein [Muribaculaceae bacterium]